MTTAPWPPGPKGHFLRGHLPELGPDWFGALLRYAREHGDFVPLRLGRQRAALVSHPDYIRQVLVTKQGDFHRIGLRVDRWQPLEKGLPKLLGKGLLVSEGRRWRRQRRLMQPAFSRNRLAVSGELAVGCAEQVLRTWDEGDVRDIYAEMVRFAGARMGVLLFGPDPEHEAAGFQAALLAATTGGPNPTVNGRPLAFADRVPMPGPLRYLRAAWRLDKVGHAIIHRRRAHGERADDLVSMLLWARDEDGGMADEQLRDEMVNLFVAGYETTAIALSWTWYLLAHHPEVESTLRAELESVLDGRTPTVADLPDLGYTRAVLTEAMRLYPPVGGLQRRAVRDSTIGEYGIPSGTIVLVSPWVTHRDSRYFEQPERFHPERWAAGLAERLPRCAYFPFNAGPHTCIGNKLAMVDLVLVVATIAQQFRIEVLPGQDVRPAGFTTLRPRGGMRAVVRRRRGARRGERSREAAHS